RHRVSGYHGYMAAAVSPARAFGAASAPCVRRTFGIGGASLSLEIADDAVLRMVEDAYALLLRDGGAARAHASIRRLFDGRLHVRYGRQTLRTASSMDPVPLRAAYHATREVFARFACEPLQTLAVYGALCAVDHGAVLLLGPTAIGKTVLAMHLAHAGAHFLGDDTTLISLARQEAYAVPRRPALRESALPLLPDSGIAQSVATSPGAFQTDRGRFWYALDAQALGGIEPSTRAYLLRAVCILGGRAANASMRSLDSSDAVKFVAPRAYARPTSLAQVGALRRVLRSVSCFEMTLGTPGESAELLLRGVRTCA
ncbi:MAG TPA: hypothetical protein VKT72_13600, partial [Candidatus Baltobacteraceae bacterium]|nr:hypothetical protein [Candidatus Baltobacteraceae bacterium]